MVIYLNLLAMYCIAMSPHVRGLSRGHLADRTRGCAQDRAGTGGCGVEASTSSSSTPGDAFGGVLGGVKFFREMVEAMREFT